MNIVDCNGPDDNDACDDDDDDDNDDEIRKRKMQAMQWKGVAATLSEF